MRVKHNYSDEFNLLHSIDIFQSKNTVKHYFRELTGNLSPDHVQKSSQKKMRSKKIKKKRKAKNEKPH